MDEDTIPILEPNRIGRPFLAVVRFVGLSDFLTYAKDEEDAKKRIKANFESWVARDGSLIAKDFEIVSLEEQK